MSLQDFDQSIEDPIEAIFSAVINSQAIGNPKNNIELQSKAYQIVQSKEGIEWAVSNFVLYKCSSIFIPLLSVINFWLSNKFEDLSGELIEDIQSNVMNISVCQECFNRMSLIHSQAIFIAHTDVGEFIDFFVSFFPNQEREWSIDFLMEFLEIIKSFRCQDKLQAIEEHNIDQYIIFHIIHSCGITLEGIQLLLSCIDIMQIETLTSEEVLELISNAMTNVETLLPALEFLTKLLSNNFDSDLKHSIIDAIVNPDIIEIILQDCEDEDIIYSTAELLSVIAPLNLESFFEISMVLYGESTLNAAEVLIDVINQIAHEEQDYTLLYTFNNIVRLLESDECFIGIIFDFLEIVDTCLNFNIESFSRFVSDHGSETDGSISNVITWVLYYERASTKGADINNINNVESFVALLDERDLENSILIFIIQKLIDLLSNSFISELNYSVISEKIIRLILENQIFVKNYKKFLKSHASKIELNEEVVQILSDSPNYDMISCLSILLSSHTKEECGTLPAAILEKSISNINPEIESTIISPLKFISKFDKNKIELVRDCGLYFIQNSQNELLISDRIFNNWLKAAFSVMQGDFTSLIENIITHEFHGKSLITFIEIISQLMSSGIEISVEIIGRVFLHVQNVYENDGSIICDVDEKRASIKMVSKASEFAMKFIQLLSEESKIQLIQFFAETFSSEYSELYLYESLLHFFNQFFVEIPQYIISNILENSWNHFLSNNYFIESNLTNIVFSFHVKCSRIEGFQDVILSGLSKICDTDGSPYVEIIASEAEEKENFAKEFYRQIKEDRLQME